MRPRRIHSYGARVARPAAAGFVELARYTVPAGRMLVAELVQAVVGVPLAVGFVSLLPGLAWEVREADSAGQNPKPLVVTPENGLQWTRQDGQPFVRGLVVGSARRLIVGAVVDPVTLAAELTHLSAAILGLEVDAEGFDERALELLR